MAWLRDLAFPWLRPERHTGGRHSPGRPGPAPRGSQAPPHWRLGPDEGCERRVVPLHLLLPEEAASVFPGGPRLEESPVLPASGTPGTGQRPGWHFVHRTSRKPQHKLAREVVATHFTDKTAAGGAMKYPRRHHQSGRRHTGAQGCPPPHGRPAPGGPCTAVFRGGDWRDLGMLLRLHGLSAHGGQVLVILEK